MQKKKKKNSIATFWKRRYKFPPIFDFSAQTFANISFPTLFSLLFFSTLFFFLFFCSSCPTLPVHFCFFFFSSTLFFFFSLRVPHSQFSWFYILSSPTSLISKVATLLLPQASTHFLSSLAAPSHCWPTISSKCKSLFLTYGFTLIWFFFNGYGAFVLIFALFLFWLESFCCSSFFRV